MFIVVQLEDFVLCSQVQPQEDDRVTPSESPAASVPSSGRNTPSQLSDVVSWNTVLYCVSIAFK